MSNLITIVCWIDSAFTTLIFLPMLYILYRKFRTSKSWTPNTMRLYLVCKVLVALCRAAISCREDAPFGPYAAAAVRNAVYDSWRHEIREKDHLCPLREDLSESLETLSHSPAQDQGLIPDAAPVQLKDTEAGAYLETLKASQCSTIQKGIEALCFRLEGYSMKELSAHYRAPSNHIRAWQSKARNFLKQDTGLYALLS